ncbi:unnamed protein product, partial [Laminaria digitata]
MRNNLRGTTHLTVRAPQKTGGLRSEKSYENTRLRRDVSTETLSIYMRYDISPFPRPGYAGSGGRRATVYFPPPPPSTVHTCERGGHTRGIDSRCHTDLLLESLGAGRPISRERPRGTLWPTPRGR